MGLTAKQLIFSAASIVAGGGIVLLLYRYIGLTPSVYMAIPVVAPIALGGFYSYNGMGFYEYMGRKLKMLLGNRPLTYVSTEGEAVIKELLAEQSAKEQAEKKKGWVCKICGYIYEGEELPADFVCPICKHGAVDFEKIG